MNGSDRSCLLATKRGQLRMPQDYDANGNGTLLEKEEVLTRSNRSMLNEDKLTKDDSVR